ncbi:MAG: response regulator [Candidatus Adiutrix sp.]|jgi:signal transduction histidine kinase/CheY-like chemotaxis protein|nr:response regulator [Candidatus Adiutrix sp.]
MDEEVLRQQIDLLQKENTKLTRQLARLQSTVDRHKAIDASLKNINAMQEVERKKQQQYLRLLLENSPDIIILFDDSKRFAHCTSTFLKAVRIPHISFIQGKEFAEVFRAFASPEWVEKVSDLMNKAVEEKRFISFEDAFSLDAHGDPRRYKVHFTPITGMGDVVESSLMLFHDITDIRLAQENAELAREAAEHASMVNSEFVANMSHEIRTPMNAVLGLTHLALQTDLNEQQYEYIHRTEVAAKALLRIINDILDFSKIEAGKLEMEETEFHLGDLMRGVMEMHAEKAHAAGVEFALDLPVETPFGLLGDPVRLAQIVNNLIGNALKFTAKGAVIVRVATLESTSETAFLKFTVEDSGIGLSPGQAAKLFNPFTQADATTTRKYGGTGLGLAISKRLAEMMGGEIWCQSESGRGSTFGFTARFKPCHLEDAGPTLTLDSFKGLRVLVVDDNAQALEILSHTLSSIGFLVVTAASGEEAIKRYAEASGQGIKFDLIVVDWQMPGMDGGEAIRRMGEAWGPLPAVLMVTGFSREEVADSARAANISKILTKPLSLSSLHDSLMEIFGRQKVKAGKKKGAAADDLSLIEAVRGARILLAEDNEVNQLVASRILANAGFEVMIAGNGLEALDLAQKERFDLILMDIQMPEMDGLTATVRLRALPQFQDLPIVAMTAHAMSGDKEQSLKAGMNDHINKPISIPELFQALARWIPPRNNSAS